VGKDDRWLLESAQEQIRVLLRVAGKTELQTHVGA
jgi:hypothetical protein